MMNRIFLRCLTTIIFVGWACVTNGTVLANKLAAQTNYCETKNIRSPEDFNVLSQHANKVSKDKDYYKAVLASLYRRGEVVQKNYDRTKELLQKAVESDQSGLAFYEFAILYQYGYGVEKNKITAEEYFKKALPLLKKIANEKKDARAQYRLAVMYNEGWGGLNKDPKQSVHFDKLAAENGHWLAQMRHGSNLKDAKDISSAEIWFCRSACNGYTHSMRLLADLYKERSEDIAKRNIDNDAQKEKEINALIAAARIWYEKSALHNPNHSEWVNLGQMLENGRVFIRDYNEAAKWYKKAGQAGDISGKYRLAMLMWFMLIEEPNQKKNAKKLFREAAHNGHEGAKNMLEFISEVDTLVR